MGVTRVLPDAAWRQRAGLAQLAAVLGAAEGDTRFVGGAVRDTLLGQPVADVDLATRLLPEETTARLRAAGIRVVPTGMAHGTVTALTAGGPVEVTTLRRDLSTDGRHAVVGFTAAWRDDAERRDFTMNALYADPVTGEIHDWFGGLDDLAARRVRFIGDPYRRIAEDHLRILRFFRFHARFGPEDQREIDVAGLEACVARANDLMALSRERIAAELLKLLVAPMAVAVVALMVARGILRPVLPEIVAADRLAAVAAREAGAGVAPDAIRRLAALVAAGDAEAVGARLKLSNADRQRLASAGGGLGDEGPLGLAYRIGPDQAVDRLLLAGKDPVPVMRWTPPRLPVTGGALVARGLSKGPVVAAALRAVETRWIAEGFPGAARVDQLADEACAAIIAQAASASSGRA